MQLNPKTALISPHGKLQSHHLDRMAVVYIRQSTLQQVEKHGESTKLQYGLVAKAYELGWPSNRVIVIDDDLGRSGANAEGRPGFQRLVAEVGVDHVGIVLGIEISRLARSCRDWYQLLEVCALFGTLIGDADGIYDPTSYNDRLLLGLKGTMSEAELHILKQRMIEGKRAKARRGELGIRLPMGYIKRPSGETVKDPDEQAQATIQLVFDLFEKFATINAVLKYLAQHQIQMPHRECSGLQKGELVWRRPNRPTLIHILHHPIYAGAYVYGRRPTDPRRKKPGRPSTGRVFVKPSQWAVCIKDKIPPYITWKQYEQNQRQIAANDLKKGMGSPRQGTSLLSGLVICGYCNHKMATQYTNNGSQLRYICNRMARDYAQLPCQSLVGHPLDELIAEQVLKALEPSALEISLQVAENVEKERQVLSAHWDKKLERARYEVERAYRQYNIIEPENRLVARTLEKKWEEALLAEEKLKQEHAEFLTQEPPVLSASEREAIRLLSSDIHGLWATPTTTPQQRQEIIRLLIERVIVKIKGKTEKVGVEIHWSGGCITQAQLVRPVAKLEQLSYYDEIKTRVEQLVKENKSAKEIALLLNYEGWKPPKKPGFNAGMVNTLLARKGIKSKKKIRSQKVSRLKNEWTIRELSQRINIAEPTLYSWMRKGLLKARHVDVSHQGVWLITADEQEIKRLQDLKNQPKAWIYSSRIKKVE